MSRSLLTHQLEGEGPPLVLANGGMMTYASWEPVAARLRSSYRLLRFDFRGQLLSPAGAAPAPRDLAGHATELLALLDAVGFERAHFVGTSFGAEVALTLAGEHSERFLSLTAITAMDRETPDFRRGNDLMQAIVQDILAGGSRQPFWEALLAGVYSAEFLAREAAAMAARGAALDRLPLSYFEGIAQILRAIEGFDLTPRLRRWGFPALVVNAGDDRIMAAERSRALAAAIGAEVVEHPRAGHGLVAEESAWLAEVCGEFLGRVPALGGAA